VPGFTASDDECNMHGEKKFGVSGVVMEDTLAFKKNTPTDFYYSK